MVKTSRVTYLIDANNYICRQRGISKPSVQDTEQFISQVDDWLRQYEQETGRVPKVLIVLDPSASACDLSDPFDRWQVVVAQPGVTADELIAEKARALHYSQPNRHIRIVTDDHHDEFERLRDDGFALYANSWLRQKLSAVKPDDDLAAYEDGQRQAARLKPRKPPLKTDEPRDDPAAAHLRRLQSDDARTRKKAARALRHFTDREAYTALERCARSDNDPSVRKTAVKSLVEVGQYLARLDSKYRLELWESLSWLSLHETDDNVRALASRWCDNLKSNWD
jgi:hypothetical protein